MENRPCSCRTPRWKPPYVVTGNPLLLPPVVGGGGVSVAHYGYVLALSVHIRWETIVAPCSLLMYVISTSSDAVWDSNAHAVSRNKKSTHA